MARARARRRDARARMPLSAHLSEFRNRLILAVIGVAIGAVAGWFFYTPVFEALQEPVLAVAVRDDAMVAVNFAGIATALDIRIKVSLFLGVIVSAPWWLYQLWAFVAPGLKAGEKRYTFGFLGAAIPLFFAGVALAWWVYPRAVEILIGFTPESAANWLEAQMFVSFATRLVLVFGIAFVFPVVMVALTWARVVRARTWLKGWRWAVLLIFVAAAVLTPTPDVVTMLFMAVPMCALYFAAVGIGLWRERARAKKEARALAS
ncbi:twin-arginine translocase subunit TatC [Demequina muriae]|uniref:Sec-independent protein translocase protein TatC n=1 Tax=Demequina muriae TaxID=3051664 RepID=A0ABT8GJU7_9MICO|nr:twin-arginine translocase subunit TatC [Demequina sp. EGI L300058]MDN4481713.1 twin-arginine translocase subunit TatC [Demequina sp. EGI L300058]